MRLRTKLQFVYCGAAGIFALLHAAIGHPLCFLFLGLAIFDWHMGLRLLEQDTKTLRGE